MNKKNGLNDTAANIGFSIKKFAEIIKNINLISNTIIMVSFIIIILLDSSISFWVGFLYWCFIGITLFFVTFYSYRLLQAVGQIVIELGEINTAAQAIKDEFIHSSSNTLSDNDELPEL